MYRKLQINDFRLFRGQTILLGRYLTVLSGRNSTGKSTILGMLANSGELKKKDGATYSGRAFRAEFSELFKASQQFDPNGADRFTITLCDDSGLETDYRSFRTAWQTKDKYRKDRHEDLSKLGSEIAEQKSPVQRQDEQRFRVIPFKKLNTGKKTEAKFEYPVLYLGLSRLFPIGESQDGSIQSKRISFKSDEHRKWFVEQYKFILSMQSDVQEITNYSIGETDKKSGIGVSTEIMTTSPIRLDKTIWGKSFWRYYPLENCEKSVVLNGRAEFYLLMKLMLHFIPQLKVDLPNCLLRKPSLINFKL